MKAIETDVTVGPDGTGVIQLKFPAEVRAGTHRAVVVVEEHPITQGDRPAPEPLDLIPLPFDGWPQDCTFRREDIYGDNGR